MSRKAKTTTQTALTPEQVETAQAIAAAKNHEPIPLKSKQTEVIAVAAPATAKNEKSDNAKAKTTRAIEVDKSGNKRKLTATQRLARARKAMIAAEKAVKREQSKSDPAYANLIALRDNLKGELAKARASYKDCKDNNVTDKLVLAKRKAAIAKLNYLVLENKKHINNYFNAPRIKKDKSKDDESMNTRVKAVSRLIDAKY